ncbi:MAG: hypothetical protein KDC09_14145 [Bacteroidales bacterium]|nr:hypothetical protein [Bacteroidales bacterium]
MNYFRSGILLLAALVIFLSGCQKDRPSPSWEVDLLTPLVSDTIHVTDILDSTFFDVNADQTISFVFDDELYKLNVDSLVKLPDTLFSWGFGLEALPNPITLQPGDTIIKEVFDWPLDIASYDIKGIKLVAALIRSGAVVFEAFDQSESDLEVVFGINSAVRNETDTFLVKESVPTFESISKSYDVSYYRLDLTGTDGDTINMLNYYLALIVHPDEPGPVTLFPTDSFAVNIYFEEIILDYARGYFGQNTFHFGPESQPIDFFNDLQIGGLSFEQAQVFLRFENYYGLEANINIQELTAINNSTGNQKTLEGLLVGEDMFVPRGVENGLESGNVTPAITNFDFSDSNFPELIAVMPDEIAYTMTFETNVLADSTHYNNFLYYDFPVQVYLQARMFGGIRIDSLLESSRMAWNGEGIQLNNVKDGNLVLALNNGFPFNLDVNLYFQDENFNNIDTLLYKAFAPGALLDADNGVAEAVITRFPIPLDDQLRESIPAASYIYYELTVNSVLNEHVVIHSTDFVELKVIGDFTYLFEN